MLEADTLALLVQYGGPVGAVVAAVLAVGGAIYKVVVKAIKSNGYARSDRVEAVVSAVKELSRETKEFRKEAKEDSEDFRREVKEDFKEVHVRIDENGKRLGDVEQLAARVDERSKVGGCKSNV